MSSTHRGMRLVMAAIVASGLLVAAGPLSSAGAAPSVVAKKAKRVQKWSNPSTWGGQVPGARDQVVIPKGASVRLDKSTPAFAGLRVDGSLAFARKNLELKSDWIMVHGNLRIGKENDPLSGPHSSTSLTGREVIAHEYGHAVQDAQVEGWGEHPDGGAMGEGFGDFLAGAYYARKISKGFQDACVADWDATSYSSDNPPCLRRLDGNKHYPKDLDPDREVHNDGEIWSAFLWDLRKSLGKNSATRSDRSITLVLASHEFLTPKATFGDAVAALRTAAKALHHKKWAKKVNRAANKRGLPLNPKKN